MVKLFKCPNCGIFIHTLAGCVDCTKRYDINVDRKGNIVTTGERDSQVGTIVYECDECGQHTQDPKDFIVDVDCNCEHLNSNLILYEGDEIDVCQYCGLILNVDYVGDD